MKKLHPSLLLTISDLLVNLSAGWFGAALIVPTFSEGRLNINLVALTVDLVFGTLCFVIAYRLKKSRRQKND